MDSRSYSQCIQIQYGDPDRHLCVVQIVHNNPQYLRRVPDMLENVRSPCLLGLLDARRIQELYVNQGYHNLRIWGILQLSEMVSVVVASSW
jgi:hypothetical protein